MDPGDRRRVGDEEDATILDDLGRVIRIVPAEEFRRIYGVPERPSRDTSRRRRERNKPRAVAEDMIEDAVPR
jgi:hypothetical protein